MQLGSFLINIPIKPLKQKILKKFIKTNFDSTEFH